MVAMPAAVVLVACKVAIAGPADQNAQFTGSQNLKWDSEHSMMQCRRFEVSLFDADAAKGADPQPFNAQRCWRSGLLLGAQWDAAHRNSNYRTWRVACPVPTVNAITGEVIAWHLPGCGDPATVHCEVDASI